jgi:hypothetical protein
VVPVTALWLPILISAVLVFLASSLVHMVLPHHRTDWKTLPAEDDVMEAMRRFNIPPGDYAMPCAGSPAAMKNPAFLAKMKRGPIAFFTVLPGGDFSMGSNLAQWFVYCVVVSIFAAYLAGAALPPGADYLEVFRFAGTTAFAAYTMALWQRSIWYKQAWSTNVKSSIDGLVYALLTAGTLGWLWPR